jgi:sulfur-oxidizing protein SoxA
MKLLLKVALFGFTSGAGLASILAATAEIPAEERRSGYEFLSRDTKAIQDDETANPGMLAVLDGEALWQRTEGPAGKSCAGCHGDARASMKAVAARYPAVDHALGRPIDIEQRINRCRTEQQQAPPLLFESGELLALTAYVCINRRDNRSRSETIENPPVHRCRP